MIHVDFNHFQWNSLLDWLMPFQATTILYAKYKLYLTFPQSPSSLNVQEWKSNLFGVILGITRIGVDGHAQISLSHSQESDSNPNTLEWLPPSSKKNGVLLLNIKRLYT